MAPPKPVRMIAVKSDFATAYRIWGELIDRGERLAERYNETEDEETLQQAIHSVETAAGISSKGVGDAPHTYNCLAGLLITRFEALGDRADLDVAITHYRSALQLTPAGNPELPIILSNLADAILTRFKLAGGCEDLDAAITQYRRVLEVRPPGHSNRCSALASLGSALRARFDQMGDAVDLNEAIAYHQDAFQLTPIGHPDRLKGLTDLAISLKTRFNLTRDRTDLDSAINHHHGAFKLTPAGHPERYKTQLNLASALLTRFDHVGYLTDLETGITHYESALQLIPLRDPHRPGIMMNLAAALHDLFQQAGDPADLDAATLLLQSTLELTPSGHPDRFKIFGNLANTFRSRFKTTGDRTDLDAAVLNYQKALELVPLGLSDRYKSLSNLASILLTRFDRLGDPADFEKALLHSHDALKLTPPGHPDRPDALNDLGNALKSRFAQVGDRADLDAAIVYYRSALEGRPSNHPYRSMTLKNLANALLTRFQQVGDPTDLDAAVFLYQGALELTPPGHIDRSRTLNNIANVLQSRFEHVGNHVDLDEAMVHRFAALELTPPGHADRFTSLNNVATALKTRFDLAGDRKYLDAAIAYYQSAIELGRPGGHDLSVILGNFGSALLARFPLTRNVTDVDEAIFCHQSALELRPHGHPGRSRTLRNIANALHTRLENTRIGLTADLSTSASRIETAQKEILRLLKEAALTTAGGPPSARLQASLDWVDFAVEWSDPSAIDAYRTSFTLLGTLIASGSSLESRHLLLTSADIRRTRSLAVDGAACAIALGRIKLAVEMLEQSRSVLFTQAGRYRTRVDDLEKCHPSLATEFRQLSTKMESSAMAIGRTPFNNIETQTAEDTVASYQKLSEQWTDVITRIRALKGFSSFIQPTPFVQLQAAASQGPVIILNLSQIRIDAIIVKADGDPFVVPLSEAKLGSIVDLSEKTHHKTDELSFKRHLCKIWQVLVRPTVKVLQEELQLQLGSRIWWCPTGAASHLPLHAAGDYTKPGQNLPDLFVSSYTPTLSSLLRSRQTLSCNLSRVQNTLAVGQSNTPGQTNLSSVELELERIKASIGQVTILGGPEGTRNAVLGAMATHPWIHLACHGHADQKQPFQSGFFLHDGLLTLLDIARQDLAHAELAFLSACHSAANNRERPDDVLHLTAGMQFAGFRTVIGTLWALCDADGPNITDSFYSSLLGKGIRPVAKSSAHALHRAVGELRMQGVPFFRWTCFVHYGC